MNRPREGPADTEASVTDIRRRPQEDPASTRRRVLGLGLGRHMSLPVPGQGERQLFTKHQQLVLHQAGLALDPDQTVCI